MSVLLDTDVLVDHLRGVTAARELLMELAAAEERPAISVITVAEIEAGTLESERDQVEALLLALYVYTLDSPIAQQAGRYRATYGKTHGVLLPDALIAATAFHHGSRLYTLNRKHYPMEDINVVVPYSRSANG